MRQVEAERAYASLARAVDDAFEAEQVPFFARLVEQPSCSREEADVEAAAEILDEYALGLGLALERHVDPNGVYAAHRVYSTPAVTAGDRALLLVGHVDTVYPRELGFFGFRRDGDSVYGPGVLDMKAGLVSVLYALTALERATPVAFSSLPVRFIVNTDEEVGSPSSRELVQRLAAQSDAALVFEAGRSADQIVTRRKGTAGFYVTARGRAAHAGLNHEQGRNAIHALALSIPRIQAVTDYARGITANVGLVRGGVSKNTVPAEAAAQVDVRYEHPEDGAALLAHMREAIDLTFEGPLEGCSLSLEGGIGRPPMEPTDATQELRRAYEAHAGAVGLCVGEAPLQGGGSDANLVAAQGTPVIDGLGPYGTLMHSPEEWSSLDSLRRRTVALARFLFERAAR